jgi:uncharacterized membrane protein
LAETDTYTEGQLRELPTKNGFRQRGMDMTRLETFTDAAFAFAVTLLVVGGGDSVPMNFEEMTAALKQIPAFAASFANIMWFWYAHHVWSRRFGLDDTRSVVLSLVLVLVVLIYVYPLKAIYSGAIDFFSGGYFDSYFGISSIEDLRSMFVIFGTAYFALSGMIALLYRHALRLGEQLSLSPVETFAADTDRITWLINAAIAFGSIVLALVLPGNWVVLSGMFYGILGIAMPWHQVRRHRRRKVLLGD